MESSTQQMVELMVLMKALGVEERMVQTGALMQVFLVLVVS